MNPDNSHYDTFKMCRICLAEPESHDNKYVNIFGLIQGEKSVIQDQMLELLKIHVDPHDIKPKIICEDCHGSLIAWFEMKKKAKEADIIVNYLAKKNCQGMAFRGHNENISSINQGNFKEACKLFAKYNPEISLMHSKTTNYTSWYIQNDIAENCSKNVREVILNEIKESNMYAIMCDEARCFKEEQLAFCVRYPKGLTVNERFLGFIDVSKSQKAEALCSKIFE